MRKKAGVEGKEVKGKGTNYSASQPECISRQNEGENGRERGLQIVCS